MNLKKTAIAGAKWTTIGVVGRSIFQLLQVSILTRFLPKEAFGLVAMALFLVQFSNIFVDMGMASAILHRQEATKKEYSSIYWLNIFISFFLYVILYFLAPFASNFYNEPELLNLVPILGVNLMLIALGRQHRVIMQKDFQFAAIAKVELIAYFIGLITAILLAINDFGLYSLVYSTLMASLISNLLFLIINLRLNPVLLHFKLKETRPFLKIGGYTMGSSLLDFSAREIDVLIIGKMLGAENLGLYTLAKQIVLKLYAIINPVIINVLNPLLASIQKDKQRIKKIYLKIVYLLSSLNFPVYLLVAVLSREILIIVYGYEYAEASLVLSFLALSYVTTSINNPVGSLQIATGRTDMGFKWTIIRLLITPIVILFAAKFNINMVAISLAVLSIILIFPLWFIQLKPMINVTLKEYIFQFSKPFVIILSIFGIFIVLFQNSFKSTYLIITISIKTSVALGLYFLLLLVLDKKRIKESLALIFNLKNQ